ncbi:MAG: LPS export ABC transporter permease LptG [Venatoribacter sp.]
MKKLDVYVAKNVFVATVVVMVVVASLDTIFSILAELNRLRNDYQLPVALQFVAMRIPRALYEYLSMACLVGCLTGLGSLAASSELTVMRASGISIARISWSVLKPIVVLMFAGLLVAQYALPPLEANAQALRAVAQGKGAVQYNSGKGFWHREGDNYIRFSATDPKGVLYNVTIYTFNDNDELTFVRSAKKAEYQNSHWQMTNVNELSITPEKTENKTLKTFAWESELTPHSLSFVTIEPRDMSISDLYSYSKYLEREGLDADRYLLSFWAKINLPLGTFALVLLGVSFIFGPLRAVSPGFRIFSGIMVGLVYKYSVELLSPASILLGFAPLLATLLPALLCFALAAYLMRRAG